MIIRTAWVLTDSGYELVAAIDEPNYDPAYFDEKLDFAALNYDFEPRLLDITIDDQLVADLFADLVDSEDL